MKFDKKIVAIIAAVLALAVIATAATLVACGNGNSNPENEETSTIETPNNSENETNNDVDQPAEELTFTECTPMDIYILHANGALNLRTAPDYTPNSIKISLDNGTKLTKIAVSSNGEWFKVEYNGEVGYVVAKHTTPLADLDEGFEACSKTLISKANLKIRIEPEINDKDAIGFYGANDEITVVAENKTTGWYKVKFVNADEQEIFGYIKSGADNFVNNKEETTESTAETTEEETEEETEAAQVK